MKEIPHNGMIWVRGFFNQWQLMLCSPEAIAEVTVTNSYAYQKPPFISGSIGRIIGFGVVLLEGDEHKFQRRKLLPAFAFRQIKGLYPVFWDKACEVVRAMTAEAASTDGGLLELQDWASRCTLDILGVAGLGRDFGAIEDAQNPLVKSYGYIMKPTTTALVLNLLRQFLPSKLVSVLPVRQNEDLDKVSEQIRTLCRDLITAKKAKLKTGEQPDRDILATAIESDAFTDEQVVDHMMTFLVAGHETSAASLNWAIYSLCKHPEMQVRLREEVRERLPAIDSGKSITHSDIDGMPYLNAVCNEVLRLYPVVPSTVREPIQDCIIQGVLVKKGTRLILPAWGMNRYAKYWGQDAEEFRPERWLPGGSSGPPRPDEHDNGPEKTKAAPKATNSATGGATTPYANMTFLHGPRSCMGQSFARGELACLLAAWVGRFEFTLKDQGDIGWKTAFTVKPGKDGLWVKAKALGGF
jgi:cytochrome P450